MKITVEIDEKKLARLMKLTGIRTKTGALDYALTTAERSACREALLSSSLSPADLEHAVDPRYDLRGLREREKPAGALTVLLIDSTVFIDLLRARRDPVDALRPWIARDELLTCGVVRCEVLRSIVNERVSERMRALFAAVQAVPADEGVWEETTRLAWMLDRRGEVLPLTDLIIAASALRAAAMVVTSDEHFRKVPGLEVLAALPPA